MFDKTGYVNLDLAYFKAFKFKKGKLALDSNIALSVLFLSPSTLIGTSVIDCQLQCLKYSIKFPANFVEPCLFKCRPYGFSCFAAIFLCVISVRRAYFLLGRRSERFSRHLVTY